MYHVYILLNKAKIRTYTGVAEDVKNLGIAIFAVITNERVHYFIISKDVFFKIGQGVSGIIHRFLPDCN